MHFFYTADQINFVNSLIRICEIKKLDIVHNEITSFDYIENNNLNYLIFTDFGLLGEKEENFWNELTLKVLLNKNICCPILILTVRNKYYLSHFYPVTHLCQNMFFLNIPFNLEKFVNEIKQINKYKNIHPHVRNRHLNYYHYLSRKLDIDLGGMTLHDIFNPIAPIFTKEIIEKWEEKFDVMVNSKNIKPEVLIIDDNWNKEEKLFYESFIKSIMETFNIIEENVHIYTDFESFKKQADERELNIENIDFAFIDIISSKEISKINQQFSNEEKFSSLFTTIPYLRKKRDFTNLPFIIVLSHDKRNIISSYSHKSGADYFMNKGPLYYQAFDGFSDTKAYLRNVIVELFASNDWRFEAPKYKLNYPKCFIDMDKLLPHKNEHESENDYEEKYRKEISMKIKINANIKFYNYVFKKILGHLHHLTKVEIIQVLAGGFSGSDVLQVVPVGKFGMYSPRVIKIDDKSKMYNEKFNYDNYIVGNMDNFCGRIEPNVAFGDEHGAISYTFAGKDYISNDNNLMTLEETISEYINNVKANYTFKYFVDKIGFLYNILDGSLHKKQKSFFSYKEFYFSVFPPVDLEEKGESKIKYKIIDYTYKKDNNSKSTITVKDDENKLYRKIISDDIIDNVLLRKGKSIVLNDLHNENDNKKNSLYFIKLKEKLYKFLSSSTKEFGLGKSKNNLCEELNNLINKYRLNDPIADLAHLFDSYYSINNLSVIHGDLNARNILISRSTDTLWLIDFAKTGYGDYLYDYSVLEFDIRYRILTDILFDKYEKGKDEKIDLNTLYSEIIITEDYFANGEIDAIKDHKLNKLYNILSLIRPKKDLKGYYRSLLMVSLKGLSFKVDKDNKKYDSFKKLYSYLFSTYLYKILIK